MATFFHLLPYVLVAVLAAIVFHVIFGGSNTNKPANHRRPKQQFYRWDDHAAHRD